MYTPRNINIERIPGDGNCFFGALLDQLTFARRSLRKYNVRSLREFGVSFLRDRMGPVGSLYADDWDGYLQRMSTDGVFAEGDIIFAMSHVLGLNINIVRVNSQTNTAEVLCHITGGPANAETLHLLYTNNNHYESIRVSSNSTSHVVTIFQQQ